MGRNAGDDTGFEARALLRAAREATLACAEAGSGPHAALVTPATDGAAAILLLLSGLSRHTALLAADPRCALLVAGPPAGANPQARPRLSLRCRAEPLAPGEAEAGLRARFLAVHPYAALYAALPDFRVWRLAPLDGLLVAGFGRAVPIAADGLRSVLPEAEEPALRRAVAAALPAERVVSVDGDGADLARGEGTIRRAFRRPLARAGEFDPAILAPGPG